MPGENGKITFTEERNVFFRLRVYFDFFHIPKNFEVSWIRKNIIDLNERIFKP